MDTKLPVLLALLCLVAPSLLAGCGSVRVLSEAQTGGTLALHGAHDAAREKAERYMRERCPDGFEVIEEGDAAGDSDDAREWRIAYRCHGSPAVAMIAF